MKNKKYIKELEKALQQAEGVIIDQLEENVQLAASLSGANHFITSMRAHEAINLTKIAEQKTIIKYLENR